MAFVLSTVGNIFFLLSLFAGVMDILDHPSMHSMRTLEQFAANAPFDFAALDQTARRYFNGHFISYVYEPIIEAPSALVFFICALISWSLSSWLKD
ncbi:hypothetical protein [Limoniibacter endophyticus]|uniref:Uncharacterized protein n=1 Tax=Limoniibacter endophyticus TaxID=1565040 RepID=A0A8J3DNK1_9HYPH|nr:hypothetical protein [Limoniibacter endophyticus]GHC66604.1 hypothetical protein GCM10010136_09820 [Limoniibacter endophyticus]